MKHKEAKYMYRTLGSTNIFMYSFVGAFGIIFLLIYNFSNYEKKSNLLSNRSLFFIELFKRKNKEHLLSKTKFWTISEILIISCVQYLPAVFFINQKFGDLVSTGGNYFGLIFFIPIILFAFFYFISVDPFKQMDLITPAYPLALIFVKLGCFCEGCCSGFRCEWGLMNYRNEPDIAKEFPSQLVEAGLGLIIFLFLLWYKKKAKEGTVYPVYVILYSATRFFSEFTRKEANVFGILKTYHILCIIGIIVGFTELMIALKFRERLTPVFNRQVSFPWYHKKNIIHHKKRK